MSSILIPSVIFSSTRFKKKISFAKGKKEREKKKISFAACSHQLAAKLRTFSEGGEALWPPGTTVLHVSSESEANCQENIRWENIGCLQWTSEIVAGRKPV